jgi:hypothetical protein
MCSTWGTGLTHEPARNFDGVKLKPVWPTASSVVQATRPSPTWVCEQRPPQHRHLAGGVANISAGQVGVANIGTLNGGLLNIGGGNLGAVNIGNGRTGILRLFG